MHNKLSKCQDLESIKFPKLKEPLLLGSCKVLPIAGAMDHERFVLVDDNARPHRAHRVDSFMEDQGISRMNWPACSPDMNPIENVWGLLKRKLSRLIRPENALIREWHDLPQDYIVYLQVCDLYEKD